MKRVDLANLFTFCTNVVSRWPCSTTLIKAASPILLIGVLIPSFSSSSTLNTSSIVPPTIAVTERPVATLRRSRFCIPLTCSLLSVLRSPLLHNRLVPCEEHSYPIPYCRLNRLQAGLHVRRPHGGRHAQTPGSKKHSASSAIDSLDGRTAWCEVSLVILGPCSIRSGLPAEDKRFGMERVERFWDMVYQIAICRI